MVEYSNSQTGKNGFVVNKLFFTAGQPPMQQHQQQQQQMQQQQQQQQMQQQQQQGGQDQGRRELRRPMQGSTPEEVARGMARMDPFGNQGTITI